jgi:cell division protein FtsN
MSDYRNRGGWNDEDDDDGRISRPSGGGVGSSSIAYESGRRRSGRRRMITLVVVALVVGGFGVIVLNAYNQGQQSNGDGVVPLIQADNAPTKVRPDQPGGMDVPNQDKLIYDRLAPGQNAPSNVERLLPPPETPMARPEPPPPPPPQQQAESMLPEAAPRAPVEHATPDIQPPPIAAPRQPTAPPTPLTPAAPPPPAQQAKPPANVASVPPPASAASGNIRIQLGAVRSHDAAQKEWERLQKANKDLLGKLSLNISQANLGDRGTFYRVQAGPVGDQQAASDLCAKLKARNVSCIIVK